MTEPNDQEQTSRLEGEKTRLEESVREHVHSEKVLETERDLFAAVLESVDAFILMLDSSGRILGVNRAVKLATGYSDDDLLDREFIAALPTSEAAAALGDGLRRLGEGADAYPFESHWATSTGQPMLVAGSLTPLRGGGALTHVIVTASDIAERRDLEDELRVLSMRDELTGLHNRRGFELLAEQRLRESRRSGSPLTIIFADVDQMKSINDGFGHDAGDIALSLCAAALAATFRESDVVARIGGDEFAVLEQAAAPSIDTVTMRLKLELERRTAASGQPFPVSLSIGSAHSRPPHAISLAGLLQRADGVMYEQKHRAAPQAE